jgi:hypothetical protein
VKNILAMKKMLFFALGGQHFGDAPESRLDFGDAADS